MLGVGVGVDLFIGVCGYELKGLSLCSHLPMWAWYSPFNLDRIAAIPSCVSIKDECHCKAIT